MNSQRIERLDTSELIADDKPILITADQTKAMTTRETKNRVFKLSDIFTPT